jgi:hypothetical protein
MKRYFLISVFFFLSLVLNAQKFNNFSDTVSYPSDIMQIMNNKLSSDDEFLLISLRDKWKSGYFTSEEKGKIMGISQIWFNRKATGTNYLNLVAFLLSSKNNPKMSIFLGKFLCFFKIYISNPKVTLNGSSKLLATIGNLFDKQYIYYSAAIQWKYDGGEVDFKCDSTRISYTIKNTRIACYSKHDSIWISETSGTFLPIENIWNGNGGSVTWERCGLSADDVKASLNNYKLELNKNEYVADSATLFYKKYFSYPVKGKLTDKVMQLSGSEICNYPEFDSYSKRFYLKNLYENVDYDGGITLKGSRIIGSGNEIEDAKIVISQSGKELMVVRSKYFVFRPERINGLNSSVRINLETDSIYHPDLNFFYYVSKKEVNFQRSENYASKSPYTDSYHKVDMDFDQLTWRVDQPIINLSMARGSTIGRARFVSQNFFNQEQYESLQGRSDIHPLVQLRKFAKTNTDIFLGNAFADYMGRPLEQVKQLLMYLAEKGFILYDSNSDVVQLKPKLYQYLKASTGNIDYDVVDFNSSVNAPMDNATLNMDNYDLIINGMPVVAVSDSQNVIIYPKDEQILLKKNRSFQFDGRIEAGLFTFSGSNFFFSYDDFKINLQSVDEVSVKVNTGEYDNFGRPVTHDIRNSIKHVTGELQIDRSDNRSGLKSLPQYPIFISRENSQVNYQYPEIEGGAYSEENFFFELYPFTLDSLDNFKKEGLAFKGKFHSAGILPDMEKELKVQPDYYFGFKFDPGVNGVPVYNGKAMAYGKFDLNSKGLRSDGKLKYLTSTTLSKDFKYYPDSMNTQSFDFSMTQQIAGIQFPKVNAKDNYIHWDTHFDEMHIKQGSTLFKMFNEETTLAGSLDLTPKGLNGQGHMDLTTADVNSKDFSYKANEIFADTSSFYLKSLHKSDYTVKTENVKSHIDFSKKNGEFTSNEDFSLVTFPENQYISYLDYFKWNMNDKTLEMGAKKSPRGKKVPANITANQQPDTTERVYDRFRFKEEPIGPRYISVNSKQDSLNFVAPRAIYDYDKNYINAFDVKLLRVADAIIYPSDGKVTISENAQMKTLYNTQVVSNYEDRFHTFHHADLNIFGRFNFTGKGLYDYVDEQDSVQVVTMKEIRVDSGKYTVGLGNILEQDKFKISPDFKYQGKLTLYSTKKLAQFDGGVSLVTECTKPPFHWLKFAAEIDPRDIYIPVDSAPKNINGGDMYNGLMMAYDSIHVYPAFLSGRRNYNDKYITTSSGFLRYNKDSSVYEIASKEKMLHRDSLGNYINYHKYNCVEYSEGVVNIGVDLGQVKIKAYGTTSFNTNSKAVNLDILMSVDFPFDNNAITMMANKIDSFPNVVGMDITRPLTVKMQNEILGTFNAQKYRDEITMSGAIKVMPPQMMHTLNFTTLRMKWNHQTRSYQSVGKIGIGNILGTQVNKLIDGFIEITRRRSGDYMDIYLKLDDKNYYYFGYTRGVMQAYSSNANFINIIRNQNISQRQTNVPRGETPYIYMVSSDSRISNFLRNYRHYLQGEATEEIPAEEVPTDGNVSPENGQQPAPGTENQNKEQKPEVIVKPGDENKNKDKGDKKEEKVIEVQ